MSTAAGVEKTEIDNEYVQLNPLKTMTAELFDDAIAERQAVLEAKDKFRSQSAFDQSLIVKDAPQLALMPRRVDSHYGTLARVPIIQQTPRLEHWFKKPSF